MKISRWRRAVGALAVAGLVFAACGSDDDTSGGDTADSKAPVATDDSSVTTDGDTATTDGESATTDGDDGSETTVVGGAGGREALALEGDVEIAEGTVLHLGDCPSDWDPYHGVDGDTINLGMSLPESGPAAAFGTMAPGMQAWFDYVNENDPIEGKSIQLIWKDDGYEAGRGVANVEEMLDTADIFAFGGIIGTPTNAAVRPITDEACVPQLLNASGFPDWGDPGNWPWTIGNVLDYSTESNIWCDAIIAEYGNDVTVAGLYTNNDFGKTYQETIQNCDVDLVAEQLHDPAAADVTNEMTTLIATDADVLVAGVTGAFCPQSVAAIAGSEWRPDIYMSYTCNNLGAYLAPVQDQVATLAEGGTTVRMTISNKVCGDPQYDDNESTMLIMEVLEEYANVTCDDGQYSTGMLMGQIIEELLRSASEMPGGLNRVNLMAATWNADFTNDNMVGGTFKTDGVNDAYFVEAAQLEEVIIDDNGELTFSPVGDLIDLEGEAGSFGG